MACALPRWCMMSISRLGTPACSGARRSRAPAPPAGSPRPGAPPPPQRQAAHHPGHRASTLDRPAVIATHTSTAKSASNTTANPTNPGPTGQWSTGRITSPDEREERHPHQHPHDPRRKEALRAQRADQPPSERRLDDQRQHEAEPGAPTRLGRECQPCRRPHDHHPAHPRHVTSGVRPHFGLRPERSRNSLRRLAIIPANPISTKATVMIPPVPKRRSSH